MHLNQQDYCFHFLLFQKILKIQINLPDKMNAFVLSVAAFSIVVHGIPTSVP